MKKVFLLFFIFLSCPLTMLGLQTREQARMSGTYFGGNNDESDGLSDSDDEVLVDDTDMENIQSETDTRSYISEISEEGYDSWTENEMYRLLNAPASNLSVPQPQLSSEEEDDDDDEPDFREVPDACDENDPDDQVAP